MPLISGHCSHYTDYFAVQLLNKGATKSVIINADKTFLLHQFHME